VSTLLIVAGLGVLGVVVTGLTLWYRASQVDELGSVSHTWIAELRAGDPYDSSR